MFLPASRAARRRACAAAFILATLVLSGCAGPSGEAQSGAAGCQVRQVADLPVTISNGFVLVPGTIDGQDMPLLVDTGAEITLVSAEAAARLGLPSDPARRASLEGVGGRVVGPSVLVRQFQVGGITLRDRELPVGMLPRLPDPALGGTAAPIGAILGADFLSAVDVEFDLPRRRMSLYRVSGCRGRFLPWQGAYSAQRLRRQRRDRMMLQVQIDGHDVTALFDTGANRSVLGTQAAERSGLTVAMLAHDPVGHSRGIDAADVPFRDHRFAEVRIGSEAFRSLPLDIADLHLHGEEMLLGADYLRLRKVWLSYATDQLFVQPERLR